MISILSKPYRCSFSKNNMNFEVQTNMYFKSAHVYPSIQITVNAFPLTGEHYIIQWTNPTTLETEEARFVAKTSYDNYYEIPNSAFSGSIEEYRNVLLQKLQESPLLNGFYVMEAVSTNKITITAKQALSELVPTWTTNQAFTQLSTVIDDWYVLPETRNGYDLRALVYFERDYLSGSFEMVADLQCIVDNDSKAVIDVAETLNAEIETSWDEYPVPFNKDGIYRSENLKRYYVKFVESWIGEPLMNSTVSDVQFVHWGGVSTDDQMMAEPLTLISNGNNFLTWWPSGKRIAKDQSDWLGWMNQFEDFTFEIKVKISTDAGESIFTLGSYFLKTFETVIFNTGYEFNDLESLVPGETIAHWSFYIKKQAGAIVSPEFRYFQDNACIRKVILGFNSFGIPETFNTSGEWEENMNVSTSIAVRTAAFGLTSLFPQSFVFDSKHTNSFKATTGMLNQKEAHRLQSLINTMITYVLEGERWIPAVVNASSTPVLKLNAFLVQIDLEILKANENDRASFFELQPDLEIITDCNGISKINVVGNLIDLTVYNDISATDLDAVTTVFEWDPIDLCYYPATPITKISQYVFQGSVETASTTYNLIKHLNYTAKVVQFAYFETGAVDIQIKSSNPSETVIIDWGDGTIQTLTYTNTITTLSHTYTKTGKKIIRMIKPCFSDVVQLALYFDYVGIDFTEFTNLESLALYNFTDRNWYFNGLRKLKYLNLNTSGVSNIEVGFQKNIENLLLSDTGITTDALDALMIELWNFRKLYTFATPAVYFVNLGFTPSATYDAITLGTGAYAGEGLVTNYGWDFNIV